MHRVVCHGHARAAPAAAGPGAQGSGRTGCSSRRIPGSSGRPLQAIRCSPGAPALPPGALGAAAAGGNTFFDVDCPLEAKPEAGRISGSRDRRRHATRRSTASPSASSTPRAKKLAISADANGGFRMEGLQPGTVTIKAEADGYMLHVQTAEVRVSRRTPRPISRCTSARRTATSRSPATRSRSRSRSTSRPTPPRSCLDSTGLLEEIADTMTRNACLKQVEIQGHTDNTGTKDHNKTLSDQRANSVREWLLGHGIEPGRLLAQGYGQERAHLAERHAPPAKSETAACSS